MLEVMVLSLVGWFFIRTIGSFVLAETLAERESRPWWAFLVSWDPSSSGAELGGAFGAEEGADGGE